MHVPSSSDEEGGQGPSAALSNSVRMVVDALAGALSGCVARVVVGPLDVIKIRFQVQLEPIRQIGDAALVKPKYTGFRQALVTIFKEEGIQGLWRGTVPGLLLTVPYTAVQFVALQQCKQYAAAMGLTGPDHPLSPTVSFASGAMAGAAGTIASYPFDLLRTTMAAQGEPKVYHNLVDATRGIVRESGVQGLYRGLGVTLVEIMPYAALQFGLYDMSKASWKKHQEAWAATHGQPHPIDNRLAHFVCGLASGMAAKLASHPLDVAKKRYQVAGLQRSLRYGARVETGFAIKSLYQGLVDIYRAEGVAGLWKGSVPSIIKAAPSAAVTFTAYEVILGWLLVGAAASQARVMAAKHERRTGLEAVTEPVVVPGASGGELKRGQGQGGKGQ